MLIEQEEVAWPLLSGPKEVRSLVRDQAGRRTTRKVNPNQQNMWKFQEATLNQCIGRIPSITEIANSLEISKKTLNNWERGMHGRESPQFLCGVFGYHGDRVPPAKDEIENHLRF